MIDKIGRRFSGSNQRVLHPVNACLVKRKENPLGLQSRPHRQHNSREQQQAD